MIINISSISYRTVEDFLCHYFPSKRIKHLLIQNKWIKIDGKAVIRKQEICGNKLSIQLFCLSENIDNPLIADKLDVVYEDDLILIVNKPAGVNTHMAVEGQVSLINMVDYYLYSKGLKYRANPIHRLDKETSGLVMFSKSSIFQPLLDRMVRNKQIHREYIAFVKGYIKPNTRFTIAEPIGKDCHHSNKRIVSKTGVYAKTLVTGIYSNGDISVVRCELETGRTHQIRVHLKYRGYPILNDSLYGCYYGGTEKMGLFGMRMKFLHPLTNENIIVESELSSEYKMGTSKNLLKSKWKGGIIKV